MQILTVAEFSKSINMSNNSAVCPGKISISTMNNLRRLCRVEGCSRVVKSQGVCQRHGAKTKPCKVQGCKKQAQGGYGQMCKSHYTAHAFSPEERHIDSFDNLQINDQLQQILKDQKNDHNYQPPLYADTTTTRIESNTNTDAISVYDVVIPSTISWSYQSSTCMPLAVYLEQGYSKKLPPGWHRDLERKAQRLHPVFDLSSPFETWEIELIWIEIGLLTGFSDTSFVHLSYAWGREPGFHHAIVRILCESRGTRRTVVSDNLHQQICIEIPQQNMAISSTGYNAARLTTEPTLFASVAAYGRNDHPGHVHPTFANSFLPVDNTLNLYQQQPVVQHQHHVQQQQQQQQYQEQQQLQQQQQTVGFMNKIWKEIDETEQSLKQSYAAFEQENLK